MTKNKLRQPIDFSARACLFLIFLFCYMTNRKTIFFREDRQMPRVFYFTVLWKNYYFFCVNVRERARTQAPTTRNCTVELPTFAVIAEVSPSVVQCKSLTLEETPR